MALWPTTLMEISWMHHGVFSQWPHSTFQSAELMGGQHITEIIVLDWSYWMLMGRRWKVVGCWTAQLKHSGDLGFYSQFLTGAGAPPVQFHKTHRCLQYGLPTEIYLRPSLMLLQGRDSFYFRSTRALTFYLFTPGSCNLARSWSTSALKLTEQFTR